MAWPSLTEAAMSAPNNYAFLQVLKEFEARSTSATKFNIGAVIVSRSIGTASLQLNTAGRFPTPDFAGISAIS
jgi:hypothetical protein